MYPTAEVRWFYTGPIPPETEAWFQQGAGDVTREPPRTDRYLRLPNTDGLNVKLREGRLEVKQRVGQATLVPFHDRVAGSVEQWRKWSFELVEPASAPSSIASTDPSWIAVRKERRLRTYQAKDGEVVVARGAPDSPAEGCELELTRIQAAGQAWWTLAFEAFGDESILQEELLLVARHVFSVDRPPLLQAGDSYGYAAWLTNISQAEAP